MGVKCNITKLALNKLNHSKNGETLMSISSIYENYLNRLDCTCINYVPCESDGLNCGDKVPAITYDCYISVKQILRVINSAIPLNQRVFTIDTNLINSTNTYKWTFSQSLFEAVEGDNKAILILKLKGDNQFVNIKTNISVKITDEMGCETTKTCYLVGDILNCGIYSLCGNASNLEVNMVTTSCPRSLNLLVSSVNY